MNKFIKIGAIGIIGIITVNATVNLIGFISDKIEENRKFKIEKERLDEYIKTLDALEEEKEKRFLESIGAIPSESE